MMKMAIAKAPKCPNCGWGGFDDWWHDKSCRSGGGMIVAIYADLDCECGATFEVTQYADGETHSAIPGRPLTQAQSQDVENTGERQS